MIMGRLIQRIGRLAVFAAASIFILSGGSAAAEQNEEDSLDAALGRARAEQNEDFTDFSAAVSQRVHDNWQSMNPDISVIIDALYQGDTSGPGMAEILEDIRGFDIGHAHNGGHGSGNGFSLREVEIHFSADVDPYFTSFVTASFEPDETEIEEAVLRDTFLPGGLQLQLGKFYSNIGRMNVQHPHDWDFVDRPLMNELIFGDHGLNEVGAQLSWLAPLERSYLLSGVELLQGENEASFQNDENHSGPRLGTGWIKYSPDILPPNHEVQFGTFAGYGRNSEHHSSRVVDGYAHFGGVDMVYKYRRPGQHYGQGNFTLQGEYMQRRTSMDYLAARSTDPITGEQFMNPDHFAVGRKQYDRQDGYYLQGVYGFAPRWRAGLRWDHIGLENSSRRAHESDKRRYDDTYRGSAMVDFAPSEFSRFRLQAGRGIYDTGDYGRKGIWDVQFQILISLGVHGAHAF